MTKSTNSAGPLERSESATWNFLEPRYGPANFEGDLGVIKPGAKEIKGVKDLINTLGAIVVQDFEPPGRIVIGDNNTPVNAHRGGGGGSTGTNPKEILRIGPKVPGKAKEKGEEQYYARLDSDEDVVRVAANRIDPILVVVEDPTRLRSHDLTHLAQAKPDRIEVKTGTGLNETIKLYKVDPITWEVVTKDKRMKANPEAVEEHGLLAALEGKKQIKQFLDDTKKKDDELGLDEKKPGPLGPVAGGESGTPTAWKCRRPRKKKRKKKKEKGRTSWKFNPRTSSRW